MKEFIVLIPCRPHFRGDIPSRSEAINRSGTKNKKPLAGIPATGIITKNYRLINTKIYGVMHQAPR